MKKYNLPTAATATPTTAPTLPAVNGGAPKAAPTAAKRPPLAATKPANPTKVSTPLPSGEGQGGGSYTDLLHKFNDASHAYYVESKPIMTDADFDALVARMKQMQQACPQLITQYGNPFATPQSDHVDGFAKVAHSYPMLSLQDIYTEEELQKFMDNMNGGCFDPMEYCVECKLDGLSLSVIYEHGNLVRAVTRGNGTQGDDVTAQASRVAGVFSYVPYFEEMPKVEVRGEVVMPWAAFHKYNDACTNEKDKFANPRNAASGTLKSYDPNKCYERGLEFVAYYIDYCGNAQRNSFQYNRLAQLESYGFNTPRQYNGARVVETNVASELLAVVHELHSQEYPFPIDGIVIKEGYFDDWEDLGYTDKFYKWGIAFKFKQESLRSRLLQVNWQLAESGRVTPVAIYEPIEMFGTTCQRATLNNPDWIEKNLPGLRIGDTLLLTKGGEIIPKVTGFVPRELTPQEKTMELVMPRSWKEDVNNPTLIIQTSGVVVPPDMIAGKPTKRKGAYLYGEIRNGLFNHSKKPVCPVAASRPVAPAAAATTSTKLQGKTILVSGNFGTPKIRKDIEAAVIANGGKLAKGVTDSVTYYVLPDNLEEWKHKAGSKWLKIQENCHQHRIITKDEFYRLIED